jgi:hypothetical protein
VEATSQTAHDTAGDCRLGRRRDPRLAFQRRLAAGTAVWGSVAAHAGLHAALVATRAGVIFSVVLGCAAPLPNATGESNTWNHWRIPIIVSDAQPDGDDGPVLVTSGYIVVPESLIEFVEPIADYARLRRRDGAYQCGLFEDVERANTYVESFLVSSWSEHLLAEFTARHMNQASSRLLSRPFAESTGTQRTDRAFPEQL